MWIVAALLLSLLVGCRESSVACELVRAFAGSRDRSSIEDPMQQPLLRACLLRDDALAQAQEALAGAPEEAREGPTETPSSED